MAVVNICRELDLHFLYNVETNADLMKDNHIHGEDDEYYREMGSVEHTDKYD